MAATAQAVTTRDKKNGNKAVGRVNMLYGFSVDRIDGKKMREFIASQPDIKLALDVDPDETDSDEQVAVALCTFYEKHTAKKSIVQCDYCLAKSSDDLSACPFCGTTDDELAEPAATPPPVVQTPVAQTASAVQDVPSKVPGAKPASTKKTKTAKGNNTPAKPVDEPTQKEEAQMQTQTNGSSSNKGLAKTAGSKGSKLTVAVLDKAMQDVEQLKSAAAGSYWQLGRKILEVYDAQLWKLRTTKDDKGKETARYKGFEAFCHHELKMSPTHAYKLMDVAKKFTEKDVSKFGATKLGLLLQAPPEDQPKIEQKIRAGASTKEVKSDVHKARKQKGFKKPSGKGRKQETKSTGRAAEKITIASIEGRKTIKLYVKPPSLRNLDFSSSTEMKRAKKLGDIPFGRLELANDVVIYITIQDHNGELVAVADTRRETGAEDEKK